MSVFRFSFFPLFSAQRKNLLGSDRFESSRLSETVESQLNSLDSGLMMPSHSGSLWISSLRAASPLIVRTVVMCSLSALLMLLSVNLVRSLLSFDLDFAKMAFLCSGVFLIEVVDQLIKYFDLIRRADMARAIQLHLIGLIHSKIYKLESSAIADLDKGNLKTLISSDVEAVEDFITAASSNWIPTFTLIIAMTPYLYMTLGVVGLVGIFVTILQIPASMAFAVLSEKLQAKAQAQQDALASLVGEWVRHIRLVRILGWQDWIADKISVVVRNYTTQTALKHSVNCITYGLSFGWWLLVAFSMLVANRAMGQPLSSVNFFSSLWALGHLSNYVQFVPYAISLYGAAAAGSKRLKTFFELKESSRHFVTEHSGADFKSSPPIAVVFENVSVIFDGKAALDNLSCRIDLDRKTAIIGEVASGKSILLDVLLGERFPDSGKVSIILASGARYNLWDRNMYKYFRSLIAYCPFEPYISNTSLRSNIDIWDNADEVKISSALQGSLLAKDVSLLSKGLDEEIGELGINLSGGQKQRTSLARAMLSGRDIYVLDDPLSAVDVASEKIIFDSIITRAKALVMVSHRLSQLHKLDCLIVMEKGRIVEEGVPSELLNNPDSAFVRYFNAHKNEEAVA